MSRQEPISDQFYNSETNEPFSHCIVCSTNLLSDETEYFIEKIIPRVKQFDVTEIIFEYAMCLECATSFRSEMSVESLKNVEAYFQSKLKQRNPIDLTKPSIDSCLLTGKPLSEASEYSYHVHCKGTNMIHSVFPYAISDLAMDEIAELLSKETTDELDDFKSKYFNGPPEIAELINPKRLLPL